MDVNIDFTKLSLARRDLADSVRVFEEAEEFSDDVARTVGHGGLSGTVQNFADSWNDRRRDLIDQLAMVHDFIDAVYESFRELDERLAKGVDPALANPGNTIDELEQYYEQREGN